MRRLLLFTFVIPHLSFLISLPAQVPQLVNYQGRIAVGTVNFNGSGSFSFALVSSGGATTYWSNDGTSTAGSQPTSAVTLTVTNGLYSVLLGDTTVTNMTAIPESVWANATVLLRVWFNDGAHGFQLLTPDQRLAPNGYLPDGSVTSAKLASGAVGSTNLAAGAVGATQLASSLTLSGTTAGAFSGPLTGNVTGNVTGSAASFTGSLAGDVTGTQSATSIAATTVTGKAITGYASTPGALTASDTVLTAIEKLNGNDVLKAPLASPSFTGTVLLPAGASSAAPLKLQTGVNLTTPALGAVEFDGANLYVTNSVSGTTTRQTVAYTSSTISASQIANGTLISAMLASGLTLGGTTTGTFSGNLTGTTITATGAINLPATTSSTVGVITQNGSSLISSYGTDNFFAGVNAGNFTMSGEDNTATGFEALTSNTMGYFNTASGGYALYSNTTASQNTALGAEALQTQSFSDSNTIWISNNVAVGYQALYLNQPTSISNGIDNTAIGATALSTNTTGYSNTASGFQALYFNTTGNFNTASGSGALYANTTGSNNIALGNGAGNALTTGNNNIDIGHPGVAGESNIIRIGDGVTQTDIYLTGTVHGNVPASIVTGTLASSQIASGAVGSTQLASGLTLGGTTTGTFSGNLTGATLAATGTLSLPATSSSSVGVITQGGSSLISTYGTRNFFAGPGAGNFTTTGADNTASGYQALSADTNGGENTAAGSQALLHNTTGGGNTAIGYQALETDTSGLNNTAVGSEALTANTTASGNAAFGCYALTATALGATALTANTTGSNNIALGNGAGNALTTGNYNIDIGNAGVAAETGIIRIGGSNQTTTYIAGISGVTISPAGAAVYVNSNGQLGTVNSSRRFKTDIEPMAGASSVLLSLKPVTFRYKPETDPLGIPQFGLIAEEVAQICPDLILRNDQGQIQTVRYEQVNAMLLNEFLKDHRQAAAFKNQQGEENKALREENAAMKRRLAELEAREKEREARLERVERLLRKNGE